MTAANSYWDERKDLQYYRDAAALAKRLAPGALSVIDVGGARCKYLERFDWIPHRTVVDPLLDANMIDEVATLGAPASRSTTYYKLSFEEFSAPLRYDLALCLQVLEHVKDPRVMAQKLLRYAPLVIVTVPYNWPAGQCVHHVNDPVNLVKMYDWFGKAPVESFVVTDDAPRLIAAYRS